MEDNHQITLTEWAETKRGLERAIMDVRRGFIRTGYYLRKIRDEKLYEQDGYDSLAKWAEDKYNLNGPTVSRLITVNEQFSEDGYSRVLDKRFEGFSFGMLVEMKDISQEGREMITPETPREDVRELRRYEKEAARAEPEEEKENTPEETLFREFLDSTYREGADALEEWEEALASEDPLPRVRDLVCPAGQKMFRSGGRLVIFKTDSIAVKMSFFGDKRMVGWDAFIETARAWAADERELRDEDEHKRAEMEKEIEEINRDEGTDDEEDLADGAGEAGEAGGDVEESDPGPTEPEGDVRRDDEAVCGGEGEEPETVETVEAEVVEEPARRPVSRIDQIKPVMPEPEGGALDLIRKVDDTYKSIGRSLEKRNWKKAATETRKLLNYIEKLEDQN